MSFAAKTLFTDTLSWFQNQIARAASRDFADPIYSMEMLSKS